MKVVHYHKMGGDIMDLTLDRVVIYDGKEYKIVEILASDLLLVVKKDEFDKGVYPMETRVIPGE